MAVGKHITDDMIQTAFIFCGICMGALIAALTFSTVIYIGVKAHVIIENMKAGTSLDTTIYLPYEEDPNDA